MWRGDTPTTNFDIFLSEPKFASFAEVAVLAEKTPEYRPGGLRAQLLFGGGKMIFVSQIDKSKSVIQKSPDETQLLFDSLMQKYFG